MLVAMQPAARHLVLNEWRCCHDGPHRKRFVIQSSIGLVVALLLLPAVQTPFASASASTPHTAQVYGTPILAWGDDL